MLFGHPNPNLYLCRAIGTGLSATPAIAQAVHASIRGWVRRVYGDSAADRIRIQYGGSVTPDTVQYIRTYCISHVFFSITYMMHTYIHTYIHAGG